MIKAVIFDMDGVIIDSEGIYLNYLYEYAKTKNPEVTLESLHGTVGTTKQDCWMVVEKAIHNGQTWQELHDEYLGRWTDIFNSIDYLSIFRLEILDVMDRLKAEGFRLAVASATNIEQVERILKENGVASRLERMISASTFKRSKPDSACFSCCPMKLPFSGDLDQKMIVSKNLFTSMSCQCCCTRSCKASSCFSGNTVSLSFVPSRRWTR